MDTPNDVVLSNAAIMSPDKPSNRTALMMVYAALSGVRAKAPLPRDLTITTTPAQIEGLFGVRPRKRDIDAAAAELVKQNFVTTSPPGASIETADNATWWTMFQRVGYTGRGSEIYIVFTQAGAKQVAEQTKHFTKLELAALANIVTPRGWRLYELASLAYSRRGKSASGAYIMSAAAAPGLMGCAGQHARVASLIERVLTPAQEEVNRASELQVQITPQRAAHGRIIAFEVRATRGTTTAQKHFAPARSLPQKNDPVACAWSSLTYAEKEAFAGPTATEIAARAQWTELSPDYKRKWREQYRENKNKPREAQEKIQREPIAHVREHIAQMRKNITATPPLKQTA